MTNQVKYNRNKDRQGLFKEDFFKTSYSENLQLLQEWIEESKSDSTIPSDALPQQLYLTMLTEYTVGFPIEEIKKRMNQIVYYCKQCLDIHRQYGQKEDIMFIGGRRSGREKSNPTLSDFAYCSNEWIGWKPLKTASIPITMTKCITIHHSGL